MKLKLNVREVELLFSWVHLLKTFTPCQPGYFQEEDLALMEKIKASFWEDKIKSKP